MTEYISGALQGCDCSNEELFNLYMEGDKAAREKLVLRNYGMVRKLAFKYNLDGKPSISTDDLIQEGYIGLMDAVDSYKPSMEGAASFIGYAIYHIKRRMLRYMKDKGRSIRIPENKFDSYRKLIKAGETLETRLMRKPTLKDLARATGESCDEIMDLRKIFSMVDSLDRPVGEDGESLFLGDGIPDPGEPYEDVEQKGYIYWVREQLDDGFKKHLNLKQIEILKARYGLDGFQEMSYAEVGELFGIASRGAQGEVERALRKLRTTAWFARLKRELREDEIIGEDNKDSYHSVENRLDRTLTADKSRLKYNSRDISTALGEIVKEVTSTGSYIRTGIITYAGGDQVEIFWGSDGITVHDPEILESLVKSGKSESVMVRND